jgi:hypothetical protein
MKNGMEQLPDGTILWYKDDELHKEDGPALVLPDGTMTWFRKGQVHSYNDQPAIITKDGKFKAWYDSGVRHRSDAPALIKEDGSESYYYLGYFAPDVDVFNLEPWRKEIEGLVAGINDAPDMAKYLKWDEEKLNEDD